MSKLQAVEELPSTMTRVEKAPVLQLVVRDLGDSFPWIEARRKVCGGEASVVRTRIPVWVLVRSRQLGANESDLLRSYPMLRAEDLADAWSCCACVGVQPVWGGLLRGERGGYIQNLVESVEEKALALKG